MLSIFKNAEQYPDRVALRDKTGSYTYKDIVKASNKTASALIGNDSDLKEQRIGFLITPSFEDVSILWGVWKAGGIGVPLSLSATELELTHYLEDSKISLLISEKEGSEILKKLSKDLSVNV